MTACPKHLQFIVDYRVTFKILKGNFSKYINEKDILQSFARNKQRRYKTITENLEHGNWGGGGYTYSHVPYSFESNNKFTKEPMKIANQFNIFVNIEPDLTKKLKKQNKTKC